MDSKDTADCKFFIVVDKRYEYMYVNPGSLCYMSNKNYNSEISKTKEPREVSVCCMGSHYKDRVRMSDLRPLSTEEAALLYSLEGDTNRLKWYQQGTALRTALGLTVDTPVIVEGYGDGVIRYVGPIPKPGPSRSPNPISAQLFGIELQGEARGRGTGDSWTKDYFQCDKYDSLVIPFSRIQPVTATSAPLSPWKASSQFQFSDLNRDEKVHYLKDQTHGLGTVISVSEKEGETYVLIRTVNGQLSVPSHCVQKLTAEDQEPMQVTDASGASVEPQTTDPALVLDLGSVVEITLDHSSSAYGVIRWIGPGPDPKITMCGLELECDRGSSDGFFNGKRCFECAPQKAIFVKLASCRPDSRFSTHPSANHSEKFANQKVAEDEAPDYEDYGVTVEPISTDQVKRLLIGPMKGIQGHCNSCYMDAALFSLFSCSSALDSLLFKVTKPKDSKIQDTLLRRIVNPLRRQGFVDSKYIMQLRQQLNDHGYSKTFTTDEKDPEEFLTIIMQHIMTLEPLLEISAGGKVQKSYYYQIFLEQNHNLILPTVQQLLEHSFHEATLKLAKAPSCLILQMPRFGKKFKMFDKIIPSLELDVTDFLTEGPQLCMLCGGLALVECSECFRDPVFGQAGFKLFCHPCSDRVHAHPQRKAHQLGRLQVPKEFSETGSAMPARDKLELFAVLCIETSHYVSFVKHGPTSRDWIFFDSMSDREGGLDGYNIPKVEACPEVGEYLDMSPAELANQVPRDMKGVAKRLFCDAYMYLYHNTINSLYC